LLAEKFREGLETFSGVLNSFGVAIAAAGTPSGSCDLRWALVVSGGHEAASSPFGSFPSRKRMARRKTSNPKKPACSIGGDEARAAP
jgi:hypothetical protein